MRASLATNCLRLSLATVFALAGCTGHGSPANVVPAAMNLGQSPLRDLAVQSGGKIQHVVVIVQENRSFDYLFHGFPKANTVDFGFGHGKKYFLKPWGLQESLDIDHEHLQFLVDYDRGKNEGFDDEIEGFSPSCPFPRNQPSCWIFYPGAQRKQLAFSFAPRNQVQPYWTMAQRFALADNTFASNNGPSYPSHQFMIAGQSQHVAENPTRTPWGCDGPGDSSTYILAFGSANPPAFPPVVGVEKRRGQPCFNYPTAANLLDKANVSWAYYAPSVVNSGGIWSAFDAIWPVRFGADWAQNVKTPETLIFNDVKAGTLPQVAWVVPALINSDHAGSDSARGPQWVAAVVNAIGQSRYWNSTAIIVMWDEWGGWYDHVLPPQYKDKQTGAYEGLGYRVPLIVISPYAKSAYVSHVQHEVASSLHFIESTFGLPSLGTSDARADALEDMFDFAQRPKPFKPIPGALRPRDLTNEKPSLRPPDDD